MPTGLEVDALVRAQIGVILFQAGYLAEVVRGGFQAAIRSGRGGAVWLGMNFEAYAMVGFFFGPCTSPSRD